MQKFYYNPNMKKCIFALCALVVCALPVFAQEAPSMDENPDSIRVSYVPNRFGDNWELSISGGISVLFNGMGHSDGTTSAPGTPSSGYKTYDAIGGVGEIAATKWFNPYIAGRIGWTTGYLPYAEADNSQSKIAKWHNYAHIDMLWDWTTQFGSYNPNRIYDAVPYVHVGVVGNPGYNVMMGGGAGFLSRFHLNDSWLINLDLRATATTSRKFGLPSGIAIDVNALVGVSYRFKERSWKKKVYNPYGPEVRRLNDENGNLRTMLDQALSENQTLADDLKKAQARAAKHDTTRVTEQVPGEGSGAYQDVPDTILLTVYYPISSTQLSAYEQAHLASHMKLLRALDPGRKHRYIVIGSADAGTGSRETNERLASKRADSIKRALVEQGVAADMIDIQTQIVESGDPRLMRASHVIIYPLLKK